MALEPSDVEQATIKMVFLANAISVFHSMVKEAGDGDGKGEG